MFKLRPYQKRVPKEVWELGQQQKNVLVTAPGGSGKTVMIAELARTALRAEKSVLLLSHRARILEQVERHLVGHGIKPDRIGRIYSGEETLPHYMSVCIASIQAYHKRLDEMPPADIVLVDEAHHTPARTYKKVLDTHPHGAVHGFTATPVRGDGVGFTQIFDELLVATTYKHLLRHGWVVSPKCYCPDVLPDTSGVRKKGADYDAKQLALLMKNKVLAGNTLKDYQRRARGKQAIGFAVSVIHAESLAERFRSAGIASEVVHGRMSASMQEAVLARYEQKTTQVLW